MHADESTVEELGPHGILEERTSEAALAFKSASLTVLKIG